MSVENIIGLLSFCFANLCNFFKGKRNSLFPLDQSNVKLKPERLSHSGFCKLFRLELPWAFCNIIFVLIGYCDYYGLGITTLPKKAVYVPNQKTTTYWGRITPFFSFLVQWKSATGHSSVYLKGVIF